MYLPVDVQIRLNEKYGLDWDKDQDQLDEKIDELLAHAETPETFARKIISLTDAVVSKLTGTDVIS